MDTSLADGDPQPRAARRHAIDLHELGGITAATTSGRSRFLVREVRGILHRADCDDNASRSTLDALLDSERAGRVADRTITLIESTLGPMVVDGNKRAAAIYESGGPAVSLPVFILTSPSGEALEPPP